MLSSVFQLFKRVFSVARKVILVIAVFALIIQLFAYFANWTKPKDHTPQVSAKQKEREEFYSFIYDPTQQKTEEDKLYARVLKWVGCNGMGEFCTEDPADARENFDQSFLGSITNVLTVPYTEPIASGYMWAYEGVENAGFVPKTYAAEGIGFAALKPIRGIWLMFRNFTLLLMVLIIVAIGFMIMFRSKMDGQAGVTVQEALPRIVFALLAITFSYPIAGFMIDLMYVAIGFVIALFSTNPDFAAFAHLQGDDLYTDYFIKNDLSLWDLMSTFSSGGVWGTAGAVYGVLPGIVKFSIDAIIALLGWEAIASVVRRQTPFVSILAIINKALGKVGDSGAAGGVGSLIAVIPHFLISIMITGLFGGLLAQVLLFLLFSLSLLYIVFRIFGMLLLSYINLLFLIVFSPLILMFEAIPGQKTFGTWLKGIILNLIPFPAVVMLSLVTVVIMNTSTDGNELWRPPYLYNIDGQYFKFIVAGVIFYSIPEVVEAIRKALGFEQQSFGLGAKGFSAGAYALTGASYSIFSGYGNIAAGLDRLGLGGQKAKEISKRLNPTEDNKDQGEVGGNG